MVLVSTVSPAPAGFELREWRTEDWHGQVFALYSAEKETWLTHVQPYVNELQGVIAYPAAEYRQQRLGRYLWLIAVPASLSAQLSELVSPILCSLVEHQTTQLHYLTHTEARLRRSEAHLKNIIDLLPQQIYAIDDQNRMILANQSYAQAHNVNVDDIVGRKTIDIAPKADINSGWFATAQRANDKVRRENKRIDINDRALATNLGTRFFHVTKIPFPFNGGNQLGVLTVATDITEHKSAAQAILQLNQDLEQRVLERTKDLADANHYLREAKAQAESANASKSLFLAMMSHEIRTPMNGVVGMIDLLRETELDHDQQKMLTTVRESSFVLLNLIDDILDFSKIEAGRLGLESIAFSLTDVLEGVAETLMPNAMQKQLTLSCFVNPDIPDQLIGDPVRLRQVLFNLCGNAIKFTHAHDDKQGLVQLRAELVAQHDDALEIVLQVEDDGIGMPPQSISKLFEPFVQAESSTTRHYGGTGLGLSICRKLVDMMGGYIEVNSLVDFGSCFSVFLHLPLVKPVPAPSHQILDNVCVIAVLAENTLRHTISNYLGYWGVDLHIVNHIEQAEALLTTLPSSTPPLLILGSLWPMPSPALAHLPTLLLAFRQDKASISYSLPAHMIRVWISPLRREDLLSALLIASGKKSAEAIGIAKKDSHPAIHKALSQHEAEQQGLLILVAEDNPVNQKVIEKQLAHLGYTCLLANDGKIAFELWQTHRFAMVISDCHMPEMDGFELTNAIRHAEKDLNQHIPIVAFTANALRGETERCLVAGMDDYLSKPVEMQALRRVLDKWMPHRKQHGNTGLQALQDKQGGK